MRESWRGGGFTADWTPADYARMAKAWPKMLQLIYRYYREGVLLTAGTDLPNQFVVPGKSLHQEMELLVQAGIPAEEVLAMSTRNAATVLGLAGDIGTVEAGERADLVVLKKNPLADIRNSSQIDLVVVKGQLLKPAALLGGR
jgi:imidazolonepropionase-like amidohydrolase